LRIDEKFIFRDLLILRMEDLYVKFPGCKIFWQNMYKM